jgi:hypothetical protein
MLPCNNGLTADVLKSARTGLLGTLAGLIDLAYTTMKRALIKYWRNLLPAWLLMLVFPIVMAQVVGRSILFDKYPFGAWAVLLMCCVVGAIYVRFALRATRPFLEDKEVTFFQRYVLWVVFSMGFAVVGLVVGALARFLLKKFI